MLLNFKKFNPNWSLYSPNVPINSLLKYVYHCQIGMKTLYLYIILPMHIGFLNSWRKASIRNLFFYFSYGRVIKEPKIFKQPPPIFPVLMVSGLQEISTGQSFWSLSVANCSFRGPSVSLFSWYLSLLNLAWPCGLQQNWDRASSKAKPYVLAVPFLHCEGNQLLHKKFNGSETTMLWGSPS